MPLTPPPQQERLLRHAAAIVESSTRTGLEMKFRQEHDAPLLRAVWKWPGVLRVYDAMTGELLAESAPGAPCTVQLPRD